MITGKDVMHLNFLKLLPFKGSDHGMRYMLRARKDDDGSFSCLEVWSWPEPYCFEETPKETLVMREVPFSEEGIEEAISWLNLQHELPERKALFSGH